MTQLAKKKMCDIARLAGVSPSTVSRALNESPLVSENTRERIKALARQNNYVINKQAQDLRRQSSNTISILTPVYNKGKQGASDPFCLELVDAIANHLANAGYELLLSRVQPDNWQRHVMAHNYVDGIIILGHGEKQDKLDYLDHLHTPTVVWGAGPQENSCLSVASNNIYGGQLAGEHLLAQGRKKIIFLGNTSRTEVGQRYRGLCESHLDAGYEVPRAISVGSCEQAFSSSIDKILEENLEFDGIVAASDLLAARAIKHLSKRGISVPEQVSVVGYGNTQLSELTYPTITTISQNISLAAKTLVDLLLQHISGEEVSDILLQPKLVVRES